MEIRVGVSLLPETFVSCDVRQRLEGVSISDNTLVASGWLRFDFFPLPRTWHSFLFFFRSLSGFFVAFRCRLAARRGGGGQRAFTALLCADDCWASERRWTAFGRIEEGWDDREMMWI